MTPLPVTVIGGYLGAGKTTLVNHLLRRAGGRRLAVLVNEFGALPIDADLIEARDGDLIAIAGGCVCCSFGSDLIGALRDMMRRDPAPDHILIEASGVAMPGAIGASIGVCDGLALAGILVLADAGAVRRQARDPYMGDTVLRQLQQADLVVLNKADLVSGAEAEDSAGWLREVAPQARGLTASQGRLPPEILLGIERVAPPPPAGGHGDDGFDSIAIRPAHPVDVRAVAAALTEPEAGVVRAKGFFQTPDGALVAIQVAGGRASVTPAPAGATPGAVLIGCKGRLNRDRLRTLLDAAPIRL